MRTIPVALAVLAPLASAPAQTAAFATTGSFFAVSVADIQASSRWYAEKFGLKVTRNVPASNTPAAPIDSPIVRPAPPALKLSGIAEDVTPDGLVRTAIISGSGELFVAKEGDTVAERYRVVKISADVVELADLTEGTTVRLALK